MNLKDPIYSKILTTQQHGNNDYPAPYVLELSNDNQGLFYYGTEHTSDPSDPKFSEIEINFKSFISKWGKERTVVAIESYVPEETLPKEEMIRKHREWGFMTFLAREAGVRMICPEPGDKILPLTAELFGFDKRDIMLWAFLNTWHHRFYKMDNLTKDDVEKLITGFRKLPGWDSIDFSDLWKYFGERFEELTGKSFLPATIGEFIKTYKNINAEEIKKLQDPFVKYTVVNDIASAVNNVRDRYIAAGILESLKKGDSVFAVFGTNHIVAQEPLFRTHFS